MAVDLLEGGEQPGAALAVEAADRAAQAVDGDAQFLALGLAGEAAFLELVQLAFGDEIDRADPLALLHLPLEPRRIPARPRAIVASSKPIRLGQQGRRAFELLAGDARHLDAAAVLRLGAGGGAGAGLAGGGLRLAGLGELRLGRAQRLLAGALVRGGGRRRLRRRRSTSPVSASICASSVSRRLGEPLRLGFGLGDAAAEFGVARLGLGGAGAPVALLLARGLGALPVGADRAGIGRRLGADLGQRGLGALGLGAQHRRPRLGRGGVGQARRRRCSASASALLRLGEVGLGQSGALGEAGAPQFEPLELDAGLVLGAARLADRGARLGLGAAAGIGGLARGLHLGQRRGGGAPRPPRPSRRRRAARSRSRRAG